MRSSGCASCSRRAVSSPRSGIASPRPRTARSARRRPRLYGIHACAPLRASSFARQRSRLRRSDRLRSRGARRRPAPRALQLHARPRARRRSAIVVHRPPTEDDRPAGSDRRRARGDRFDHSVRIPFDCFSRRRSLCRFHEMDKREAVRVPVRMLARCHAHDEVFDGTVEDISRSGMLFTAAHRAQLGGSHRRRSSSSSRASSCGSSPRSCASWTHPPGSALRFLGHPAPRAAPAVRSRTSSCTATRGT